MFFNKFSIALARRQARAVIDCSIFTWDFYPRLMLMPSLIKQARSFPLTSNDFFIIFVSTSAMWIYLLVDQPRLFRVWRIFCQFDKDENSLIPLDLKSSCDKDVIHWFGSFGTISIRDRHFVFFGNRSPLEVVWWWNQNKQIIKNHFKDQ